MMNNISLMGRLTKKPELQQTANGIPYSKFTLAVGRNYAKDGAERQTDFINCTAWRGNAEFITKHFDRGQMVAMNGPLQTGSYIDNDGVKHWTAEVVADNIYFAEPKREQSKEASQDAKQAIVADKEAAQEVETEMAEPELY